MPVRVSLARHLQSDSQLVCPIQSSGVVVVRERSAPASDFIRRQPEKLEQPAYRILPARTSVSSVCSVSSTGVSVSNVCN